MLLALGMTLVIATGGVDLSVGAVMAITGAVAALLVTKADLAVPAIIAAALGVALIAGIWNGILVGWLGVPPIVATLILMVSGRGIAQLLTDGQIITFQNRGLEFIGRGKFPWPALRNHARADRFSHRHFPSNKNRGGIVHRINRRQRDGEPLRGREHAGREVDRLFVLRDLRGARRAWS
jgi:hypothetical protein